MQILERCLCYSTDQGELAIPIAVERPVQGDQDWSCRYSIGWPDGTLHRSGYGVDAVQALLLTLQAIGTDIYTSSYHRSGRLKWLVPGDGYGFPVPKTISDLLVGSDAASLGLRD